MVQAFLDASLSGTIRGRKWGVNAEARAGGGAPVPPSLGLTPFISLPPSIRRDAAGCRIPQGGGRKGCVRLWKTLAFSLVFRFASAPQAGHPRPGIPSASLPPFHVRDAVSMGFNVGIPPAFHPSGRGWKPHLRKSRDGCPECSAPLPGVRHLAAPLCKEGFRTGGGARPPSHAHRPSRPLNRPGFWPIRWPVGERGVFQ